MHVLHAVFLSILVVIVDAMPVIAKIEQRSTSTIGPVPATSSEAADFTSSRVREQGSTSTHRPVPATSEEAELTNEAKSGIHGLATNDQPIWSHYMSVIRRMKSRTDTNPNPIINIHNHTAGTHSDNTIYYLIGAGFCIVVLLLVGFACFRYTQCGNCLSNNVCCTNFCSTCSGLSSCCRDPELEDSKDGCCFAWCCC